RSADRSSPAPCDSPKHRRSGSRSSRSIRRAGAPSPTGSWPRRSVVGRRSGWGKGLGALIPTAGMVDEDAQLRELPISQIEPNRYQPRSTFDEELLVSLAASIRAVGVLQPILVRPAGPERFELIAGERRWRA